MHLAPTTEQQELKDAVRRFCQEQMTQERLTAWEKQPGGIDAECWRAITALGWLGLGLPVSAGGSGLGLVEVACLLEECARGLVPRRVINAIRGGVALALVHAQSADLPAVARGERSVTLALDERYTRDAAAYQTRLITRGDTLQLDGEKWYVAAAAFPEIHIVAARDGDDVALVRAPGREATSAPLRTFDGEYQGVVRYEKVGVQRLSAPGRGTQMLRALCRQQTALALAEMIGGMDAVLAMTVDYVKQREQFGQKIAVFQAVQHQVADMATAYTAGRHLAWQAITRVAAGTEEGTELAHAAAFVGQAFKRLTLTALHLHGGAGYVVEHPLHYHAERAQALCIRYTPEAAALESVAAALLDTA